MSGFGIARRFLAVTAALLVAGWATTAPAQETKNEEPKKEKNILEMAKDSGNLKTFARLVEAAGLTATFTGKEAHTVFAPTDEAFQKLGQAKLDELLKPENKAQLQKILKHHVLAGKHNAAEIKGMKTAKTLSGGNVKIEVKDANVMIDQGKVTKADAMASNGVIHIIDTVLMPAN